MAYAMSCPHPFNNVKNYVPINALAAVGALITLIDLTLSNARRFYSSMGNPLAVKGLRTIIDRAKRFLSTPNAFFRECINLKSIFLKIYILRISSTGPCTTSSNLQTRIILHRIADRTIPYGSLSRLKIRMFADDFATSEDRSTKIYNQFSQAKRSWTSLRITEVKPPEASQQHNIICAMQIIWVTHACHQLHQRVDEHKDSVIGKHFEDEQNLRPSKVYANFEILKICRSKHKCQIFEAL